MAKKPLKQRRSGSDAAQTTGASAAQHSVTPSAAAESLAVGPPVAGFTSPLQVADVGRAEQYRPIRMLLTDLDYGLGDRKSVRRIVALAGFCCDGASVPPGFRWLFPPWGVYAQAAIIHDWLYATHDMTRKDADDLFFTMIAELRSEIDGAGGDDPDPKTARGYFMAWLGWLAVRIGGASAYAGGRTTFAKRAKAARNRLLEKDYRDLAEKVLLDLPKPQSVRALQP